MAILDLNMNAISELALLVTQAMLTKEDEAKEVTGDEEGPLKLASALDEFFQMCGALEAGHVELDSDELSEFAAYGIGLLDRLAYLTRQLELMDQRVNMAKIQASLAVVLVRHGAIIDNLEGAADSFAMLVNGLNDQQELADICRLMEEVIEATPEELQLDQDRDNPWRPWRVINLNAGIAATRSLDADLMENMFENLGRRIPYDMPAFLADGKRQMVGQNVPDEVSEVMNRFAEKWAEKKPH